jgi:CubicO group peptidase (beta-lactamase class C family)
VSDGTDATHNMTEDVSEDASAEWTALATRRLESLVADGIFAVGAQLWVAHRGGVACDLALGDAVAGPMTPETVHNNYCLGKPFLGLAIGRLWADGRLDPRAPIDELDLPEWAVPPFPCSVLDVLDHQAGLDGLSAMEYRITPDAARPALVASRIARAERRPAYSEILGGLILEEVIRAATGCSSVSDEIRRSVLAPLGVPQVAIDPGTARALNSAGRVSVPFGGLPTRRVPLLFELLDASFRDLRPAFGLLCSARAMGLALERVRDSLVDRRAEPILDAKVLTDLLTPRHDAFFDARAFRTLSVAGGFMVDVVANELARHASRRSIGHNAGMASAVAFTDLDHDLTISLYLNGAEVGPPTARIECRAIADDLYRGLGLA